MLQQRIVDLHRRADHQPIGVFQLLRQPVLDLVMRHNVPARLGLKYGKCGGRNFLCENNLHGWLLCG